MPSQDSYMLHYVSLSGIRSKLINLALTDPPESVQSLQGLSTLCCQTSPLLPLLLHVVSFDSQLLQWMSNGTRLEEGKGRSTKISIETSQTTPSVQYVQQLPNAHCFARRARKSHSERRRRRSSNQ